MTARPPEVTELARAIYDCPRDMLSHHLERLGWQKTGEAQFSGAWTVRKGKHLKVMITFGGPDYTAAAFQWWGAGSAGGRF
jgi:hypothetical protein